MADDGIKIMDVAKLKIAIDNAIKNSVEKVKFKAEAKAISLVPVDTGRLKGSITVKDLGPYNFELRAGYTNDVDYAQYVEYGTSKMKAQPFLRPAIEYARKEVVKDLNKEIKKIKIK